MGFGSAAHAFAVANYGYIELGGSSIGPDFSWRDDVTVSDQLTLDYVLQGSVQVGYNATVLIEGNVTVPEDFQPDVTANRLITTLGFIAQGGGSSDCSSVDIGRESFSRVCHVEMHLFGFGNPQDPTTLDLTPTLSFQAFLNSQCLSLQDPLHTCPASSKYDVKIRIVDLSTFPSDLSFQVASGTDYDAIPATFVPEPASYPCVFGGLVSLLLTKKRWSKFRFGPSWRKPLASVETLCSGCAIARDQS